MHKKPVNGFQLAQVNAMRIEQVFIRYSSQSNSREVVFLHDGLGIGLFVEKLIML